MRGHARTGRPLLVLRAVSTLMLLFACTSPHTRAQQAEPSIGDEPNETSEPATSEAPAEPDPGAPAPSAPAVLLAAGDIASCDSPGDEATAALLDGLDGMIATLGDTAYGAGTPAEFGQCYEPSWGRHKGRTRPAPGNHDYGTPGAAAYFNYFGAAAGEADKGYYSYDLGDWHLVALNSNCAAVGGCHAGSPQEQWLRADLAAHPTPCALAYWHHPRFSSGPHGGDVALEPIWQALYDAGADVVLVGHDHLYERFAPQDPRGVADSARGIRQFTVGTGGRSHYSVVRNTANSEVANSDTFGVLRLTLRPADYDWEFVPVAGGSFTDSGSGSCHS
jgi:acid phosphatase type 7